ncbi:MAG: VCBS repeat-containing protein [Planctomycetaceae bacterium]|nr:VCBS repeat-containing protein [Planctomycetaceae bacterium]
MLRELTAMTVLLISSTIATADHPLPFTVKVLTVDANEGCDVADVDNDGKLDVIAGRNWFRNGEWVARPVRQINDWNGYVESNGDFAYDVNGDGWVDVIAGMFIPTKVHWYQNPGVEGLKLGQMWQEHELVDTGLSQNEASFLRDFDGDGKPEWISDSWNKDNPLYVWTLKTGDEAELVRHLIGEKGNGHGMGFGDINNDGREDILVGNGWHERPEGNPFEEPWMFHADWELHASCPVHVRDVDGDGVNDLVWGKGHDYGLMLWRGRGAAEDGKLQFEEQIIDDSFSQPHAVEFADLNGDGKDELITGKRVRAHNGGDPGGAEPPIVCYYTWNADQDRYDRHVIEDGHVGIGLQIRTADIDGDGDTDIVVAGKDGTQVLFNGLK